VASIIDTNGARPERPSRRQLDVHERPTPTALLPRQYDSRPTSREGRDRRVALSSFSLLSTRRDDVRHDVSVEAVQITGHNVRIGEQIDFLARTGSVIAAERSLAMKFGTTRGASNVSTSFAYRLSVLIGTRPPAVWAGGRGSSRFTQRGPSLYDSRRGGRK
jgi:hypothetical protein